jgi:tetratricopeptide (TPR) repeat protein
LVSADTVLILPFFNLTKSPNLDWIGESISESIMEELSAQGVLVVEHSARDEALKQLGIKRYVALTRGSILELAASADAGTVVSGEFQVSGDAPKTLQIEVRVMNARQMRRGGEYSGSGPLEDLSRLQARAVWQVLNELAPGRAGTEGAFLQDRPSIRLDAMESYVRALITVAPEARHKWLAQAVRLQPDYSQACYQMGRSEFERKDYPSAAQWFKKVSQRDAHFRGALFFLGLSEFEKGDYQAAEAALQRVAADVPLPEVLNNLGAAQLQAGKPEALENFKHAVEGDPADPDYHFNAGYALWRAGRFEDAKDYFRAVLDREPADEFATILLGRCLKQAGPRPGEVRMEGLVLLKYRFNESAWFQLQAIMQKK